MSKPRLPTDFLIADIRSGNYNNPTKFKDANAEEKHICIYYKIETVYGTYNKLSHEVRDNLVDWAKKHTHLVNLDDKTPDYKYAPYHLYFRFPNKEAAFKLLDEVHDKYAFAVDKVHQINCKCPEIVTAKFLKKDIQNMLSKGGLSR